MCCSYSQKCQDVANIVAVQLTAGRVTIVPPVRIVEAVVGGVPAAVGAVEAIAAVGVEGTTSMEEEDRMIRQGTLPEEVSEGSSEGFSEEVKEEEVMTEAAAGEEIGLHGMMGRSRTMPLS